MKALVSWFKKNLKREVGYKEILDVAIPLMISSAGLSLLMFIDRMFVSWYSADALAASMPAGVFSFALSSLFFGTTMYVGTFVSQYFGAKKNERIGPSIWQGLYLSLFSGLMMLIFIPLAPFLFQSFKHDPVVTELEISYFRILCLGTFPMIAITVLGAFYSGRGITRPVMWMNILMLLLNTPLNALLVFGYGDVQAMGLDGAGWATIISQYTTMIVFAYLVFRKKNNKAFATLSGWKFDSELFRRLIRFGLPSGVHMFIEVMAINIFIMMVGNLGKDIQAASNIAFQIDIFGFIIIHAVSIAISIKVGQYIGANDIVKAEASAITGLQVSLMVAFLLALVYIFFPSQLVGLFGLNADPEEFSKISELAERLLVFVAVYCFFDAIQLALSSAIKGAGDTFFVMKYLGITSVVVMIIPSILIVNYWGGDVYGMWGLLTFFVLTLASIYTLRFRSGKWKEMKVIEE